MVEEQTVEVRNVQSRIYGTARSLFWPVNPTVWKTSTLLYIASEGESGILNSCESKPVKYEEDKSSCRKQKWLYFHLYSQELKI